MIIYFANASSFLKYHLGQRRSIEISPPGWMEYLPRKFCVEILFILLLELPFLWDVHIICGSYPLLAKYVNGLIRCINCYIAALGTNFFKAD